MSLMELHSWWCGLPVVMGPLSMRAVDSFQLCRKMKASSENEHYSCMVDLLGRVGHLEEAKISIHDMPVEPNGVTWTTLLGASRTYGNVELD